MSLMTNNHNTINSSSQFSSTTVILDRGSDQFDSGDKSEPNPNLNEGTQAQIDDFLDGLLYSFNSSHSTDERIEERVIENSIEIFEEPFSLESSEDGILLHHNEWSLVGSGESLYEAEKNLYQMMQLMYEDFASEDDSRLTGNAIRLKDFLIKNC